MERFAGTLLESVLCSSMRQADACLFLLRTRRSLWALRPKSRMKPSPLLNLSVNGLPHLRTRRGMKQGFEERQIARAKVIFNARLPSSTGFLLLRFLIHKPNPLQSAKSKLALACRLHSNRKSPWASIQPSPGTIIVKESSWVRQR